MDVFLNLSGFTKDILISFLMKAYKYKNMSVSTLQMVFFNRRKV